jgi:hypothetical protein
VRLIAKPQVLANSWVVAVGLAIIALWFVVGAVAGGRQGAWRVIAEQPAPCVAAAPAYVGASEDGAIGLVGSDCVLRWWKR